MKRQWLLLTLSMMFALGMSGPVAAQLQSSPESEPRSAYGIYGDAAFVDHNADFRAIPGFPNCCPQFSRGTGIDPDFGAYYKLPLGSSLNFYLRLGYSGYGAKLSTREGTTVLDTNGAPVAGGFDHTIVASLGSIGIEPMLGIILFQNFSIRLGGRAAYVVTKRFGQSETIAEPTTFGVFTDTRTRTRNVFSNEPLPNASSIEADVLAGISYEVPMNASGTLHAVPEAYYSLGLTQITQDLTWKANAIRAGVGIEYTPPAPEPPHDTIIPPPPPPKKMILAANVTAVGLNADGSEMPTAKITVEEFSSTRLRPLLNYVFFDDSSSSIPARYTRLTSRETANFRVEKLYHLETLPTYYQLLNIVGRRMVEHPDASITVVGCNSDERKEHGNKGLSRDRAEHVRGYLHDVWGIPESRMKLEIRNLPERPSYVSDSDGIVENRRVEIQSSDWNIVQPVFTHDTITRISPSGIRFKPTVQADAGVRKWTLTAEEHATPVKSFAGPGTVPKNLDWSIDSSDPTLARQAGSVEYALHVVDDAGQNVATTPAEIPVEKVTIEKKRSERIADKEIDHYSLILFDFDQANLSAANQKISQYVKDHTPPDATVTITGYTDRMGDDVHNQHLAETRAAETAKLLNVKTDAIKGVGKSQLLYDNTLPEGRFYCRTVNIDVVRDVKE